VECGGFFLDFLDFSSSFLSPFSFFLSPLLSLSSLSFPKASTRFVGQGNWKVIGKYKNFSKSPGPGNPSVNPQVPTHFSYPGQTG
jgi:hypothetical protein